MELLKSLLSIALLLYASLFFVAYTLSDRMIFLPPVATYEDGDDVVKISTNRGYLLSSVYLDASKANNYTGFTLLYSHGNGEDLGLVSSQVKMLFDHGFSVLAYDYSGYGTSGGSASEKNTFLDIEDVYAHMLQDMELKPEQIIIMGFSVGSGPSVHLAAQHITAGLIVQSAFVSAFRVQTVYKILPFDKFDNLAIIDRVRSPVLFIHGDDDNVIPSWHGRELYKYAQKPKMFYEVRGAGHNDLLAVAGEDYYQQLIEFARGL